MKTKYVIFDLDDTLVYEIDFLKSAYHEIALSLSDESLFDLMFEKYKNGENVFEYLSSIYKVDISTLLEQYRNHFPNIKLMEGAEEILTFCKENNFKLGLITDGRSVTQRNKLKALNIENLFDKIIVSEEFGSSKPDERNFKIFIEEEMKEYFYIADNPLKDFIIPNKLSWTSVCLLNKGQNIHQQIFDLEKSYLPKIIIKSLSDLKNIFVKVVENQRKAIKYIK